MFRNLLGFWRGKDFLSQVLKEFEGMLNDTHEMFVSAFGNLFSAEESSDLKEDIYEVDRRVNALQKDIRKRVIEHLTLQPSVDTAACLILMSVVKDAERLGDFAKNLLETRSLLIKPLDRETYKSFFNGIDGEIDELFTRTKDAYIGSDEEKARSTWDCQRRIKTRCNEVVFRAARSDLSPNEAVCIALIARYFKRIASHLTNIATSVVVPLDNLDYFDEDLNPGHKSI